MSFTNFAKILEIALNSGKDPRTGLIVGRRNGKAPVDSWEALWQVWEEQIAHFVRMRIRGDTIIDLAIEELVPDAFCSALIQDCIERGKHLKEGGAVYDLVCGPETGLADTANSLAAVKHLVFDERVLSMHKLLEALANDFEGVEGERIRQMLINRAPKYGNDQEEVDQIASDGFLSYIRELDKYHNTRFGRGPIGCTYYPCTATISANVPLGKRVGALPSGRKAYTPVAEGISPGQGTDRSGPTAAMKSVARLPNILVTGGNLLNQRLSPNILASEEGLERLVNLVRGFFKLDGWHIQFNVVSSDTLRDAQRHPGRYADLVVRVAGYSARFVELSPEVQEDIIARTEHTL
jgi:formate C-acetyltransferase